MTSRGNLNSLRKLFMWESTWSSSCHYKKLQFRDLIINNYLSSLFYKLRVATSYFLVKSSLFGIHTIECDIYFLKKHTVLSIFRKKCKLISLMKTFFYLLGYRKEFHKTHTWHLYCNSVLFRSLEHSILKRFFLKYIFFTSKKEHILFLKHVICFNSSNIFFINLYKSSEISFFHKKSRTFKRSIGLKALYYRMWVIYRSCYSYNSFCKNTLYIKSSSYLSFYSINNHIKIYMSVFKNVVLKYVLKISYLSVVKPFFYTTVLSSRLKSKKKPNIWKLYIRTFLFFFFKKIESSLNNYTRSLYLFLPTIYNRFKPFIKSAKIVCEVIVLGIESGKSIKQVFSMVKTWIARQQSIRATFEDRPVKDRVTSLSCIPLRGIRSVCKGPSYRGRRKRKFFFHTWVSDDWLVGRMPSQTFDAQIDYYQSFAIQTYGSVGIKVWTLYQFFSDKK